jgi:hypothetical protein
MTRNRILTIAAATLVLATVGALVYAQEKFDKYTLKSPDGIAFADFRGYEDWAVLSSPVPIRNSRSSSPIRR